MTMLTCGSAVQTRFAALLLLIALVPSRRPLGAEAFSSHPSLFLQRSSFSESLGICRQESCRFSEPDDDGLFEITIEHDSFGGGGGSLADESVRTKKRNGVQIRRPNNKRMHKNPAMADTSFLRKRTSDLLRITSDDADVAGSDQPKLGRNMKVDMKTFHFLMDAWAFSGETDAVDHAKRLLQRMRELRGTGVDVSPDVRSYTKVINAISRSASPTAGQEAEELLHEMEMLDGTGSSSAKPNTYTYTAVIEAHANSDDSPEAAQRAEELCEVMIRKYQAGDPDVTPTARAFNAVISAHAKVGAAEAAERVFDRMEELYESSGLEEVKPNAFHLNSLITGWANCVTPGSAQRAEQVLERMEYLFQQKDNVDAKPTTVSFNAVIDAHAKSGEDGAAQKAEALLMHMEQLYESGENTNAKPNVRSFNSVMNAWAKSRDPDAAGRAQDMLNLMEKLYEDGNAEVRPDVHSFCTVITAVARSQTVPRKAERALNLYNEMKALYKAGNNPHLRPNVVAVNAVMNACAYTSLGADVWEQNRAVEISHIVLKDLEKNGLDSPDQVTYGTFMKVCATQMTDCDSRQKIVETLFKKCCKDGQVGNMVLQQMKSVASPEQYEALVGKPHDAEVKMDDLPPEWWCNVVEGRWRRKRVSTTSNR